MHITEKGHGAGVAGIAGVGHAADGKRCRSHLLAKCDIAGSLHPEVAIARDIGSDLMRASQHIDETFAPRSARRYGLTDPVGGDAGVHISQKFESAHAAIRIPQVCGCRRSSQAESRFVGRTIGHAIAPIGRVAPIRRSAAIAADPSGENRGGGNSGGAMQSDDGHGDESVGTTPSRTNADFRDNLNRDRVHCQQFHGFGFVGFGTEVNG